jgi:hypothetical protein
MVAQPYVSCNQHPLYRKEKLHTTIYAPLRSEPRCLYIIHIPDNEQQRNRNQSISLHYTTLHYTTLHYTTGHTGYSTGYSSSAQGPTFDELDALGVVLEHHGLCGHALRGIHGRLLTEDHLVEVELHTAER